MDYEAELTGLRKQLMDRMQVLAGSDPLANRIQGQIDILVLITTPTPESEAEE